MLETVRSYIQSVDDISFRSYFTAYVMCVQDNNIEKEVISLINRNTLNICVMDKILATTYEGLVKI